MTTKETSHPLLSATKHNEFRVPGPGTAGLVDNPADWPFSSFRRCVSRGFPADWFGGGAEPAETGDARNRSVGMRRAFPPYACFWSKYLFVERNDGQV